MYEKLFTVYNLFLTYYPFIQKKINDRRSNTDLASGYVKR